MFVILICVSLAGGECRAFSAVNGTEMQCRALMMEGPGRVSCVAPDGTMISRMPTERRTQK